jgi:hypothetical protein
MLQPDKRTGISVGQADMSAQMQPNAGAGATAAQGIGSADAAAPGRRFLTLKFQAAQGRGSGGTEGFVQIPNQTRGAAEGRSDAVSLKRMQW